MSVRTRNKTQCHFWNICGLFITRHRKFKSVLMWIIVGLANFAFTKASYKSSLNLMIKWMSSFWFSLIFQVTIGIPNIYICRQHLFLYELDSKIVESNCCVFVWWELKFLFHTFFPRSNPRGWNVIYVMSMNFLILLLAQLKTHETQ